MLKNVLSHETCANCQICCSFVREDAWESPVFSEEDMKKILALGIESGRFEEKEEQGQKTYTAKYDFETDSQILLCPCLDEKTGCMLGENKPFECSIWPVRIFENENGAYLGIASVCPAFKDEKLEKLLHELKENGLGEKILSMKSRQHRVRKQEKGYVTSCFFRPK